MKLRGGLVERLALPVVLIVGWWLFARNSTSVYFPPLGDIVASLREWLPTGFATDVLPSMRNLVLGYLIAVVVGVLLGVLLGRVPTAEFAVAPILHFFRSVPPAALLPLFILGMGPTTAMRVSVIAFGSVWPTLLATIDGVRGVDPLTLDVTRIYRTSRARRFFRVLIPAASPLILAGMKTSLAFSIILVVVSEMMASTEGIGFFIFSSQQYFNLPALWAGTIVMGVIGYVLSEIFFVSERRLVRWKGDSDDSADR
jgi:sulfonate transport system permease protein